MLEGIESIVGAPVFGCLVLKMDVLLEGRPSLSSPTRDLKDCGFLCVEVDELHSSRRIRCARARGERKRSAC